MLSAWADLPWESAPKQQNEFKDFAVLSVI